MIDENKFWARVAKGAATECWPWLGANQRTGGGGYGKFHIGGDRYRYAHRIAWEQANGRPLRPGTFVCHTCDNPPCCNPAHLFEGQPRDNIRDMLAKGRGWHLPNKCRSGHDLTPENSIVRRDGRRYCRTCARAKWRKEYAEKPWEHCEACGRDVSPGNMHGHIKTKRHIRVVNGGDQ